MPDLSLLSLFSAFGFGILSFFLSLCILPLIPAYLTFIAGTSVQEIEQNPAKARRQIALNALAFVLGLALFFALLGVLLQSILSNVAFSVRTYLGYFFGALIIVFGLMMMGLLKIPLLQREHKLQVRVSNKSVFTSFLFGAAFAVGWTPCVSPFLGVLFGIAATQPVQAFPFLLSYGLGLGLPFLLIGLFFSRASNLLKKIVPYSKPLNFAFGILFIILGILVFTNQLVVVVNSLIPEQVVQWISQFEANLG